MLTPNEIKARLILQGIKQREIADRLGVSRCLISLVITGYRKSPRVRKAIARSLGMKVGELWPKNNNKKAA